MTLTTDPTEVLDDDECWELLQDADIGRLGVRAGDEVDIFPVNFLVRDRILYFRSAPGTKLIDLTRASSVAFEIDGHHRRTHWSVVVHGMAERMSFDDEITASGIQELDTMTSSTKWNYVRITPDRVTGRRFRAER